MTNLASVTINGVKKGFLQMYNKKNLISSFALNVSSHTACNKNKAIKSKEPC